MSERKNGLAVGRFGDRLKLFYVVVAVVAWVGLLVPPLRSWSLRYGFVEAAQFCVFAAVVPALLTLGAPWRRSRGLLEAGDGAPPAGHVSWLGRWSRVRQSQNGRRRAVVLVVVFMVQCVLWRSAPLVNALVRHPWLALLESVTLVGNGVPLWMELVDSPPFRPATTRPYRIGMAAALMWTIWVIAYLGAMANGTWYSAFHYVSGVGVSRAADQQLTAGIMWAISAAVFLPLVFWNLIQWLQNEEDPDDELYRLVRDERTRGFFGSDD